MEIAQFIRSIDAFRCLSEASAQQLAKRAALQTYKAGEMILKKGDVGDSMFIIFKGVVHVPLINDQGERVYLARLGEGKFFGELALLTGDPRNADVIAASECQCIVLRKGPVLELIREYSAIGRFLTEILGRRLMDFGGIRKVGKYKLIGEIGRGGVAVVYEGVHPTLGRPVAIKMLSHELVYHRHFADRFRNEAKIIAALHHPNIVEVHDAEEAYATFFIVMEKIAGEDLDRFIAKGPIPFNTIRKLLIQIASALDYAHQRGIVHRDVKPSNVILTAEGDAKLTDFGLALVRRLENNLDVPDDISIGTPTYMSPEQAMGKVVDNRTDIYALGIVAYEMVTGQLPFTGRTAHEVMSQHVTAPFPSPRRANPAIPKDIEQLIHKATQKKPSERYQSCREILELLEGSDCPKVKLENLRTRTVTFVYLKEHEDEVGNLIEDLADHVTRMEGVRMD